MVVKYNSLNFNQSTKTVSNSKAIQQLTSENVQFLISLGFKLK